MAGSGGWGEPTTGISADRAAAANRLAPRLGARHIAAAVRDASIDRQKKMIDVVLDPGIASVAPDLVLGCLSAAVRTAPGSEALWEEMQRAAQDAAADATEPAARAPIAATRELYRRLGKDPSRYRGSPEALLRRARSGKELYRIHNVVDVINLVSLRTLLPIGLYDAAKLRPPVVLRRGATGEAYDGIGKEALNLDGLPVLADAEGPFGSPTSDSRRTMVTEETREVFAVVFGVTGRGELEPAMEMLSRLLLRHAAASHIATTMVSAP
jgi:DNA/RNA-binding domain of Phe-tRNA-synthetase-like protein